jgi:hypothetical protein
MLVHALSMLLALSLGACSISGFLPDWTSADVAGPEPAYRFMIANRIKEIVGDPNSAGALEISDAWRVDSVKGASWLVCIRAQRFPQLPRYYAVFFQRGQMIDSRLSVLIDQCEMQTFVPFDWAVDAGNVPRQ